MPGVHVASLHKWPERAVSRLGGKQTLSRHGPEAMAQPFPERLPGALLWSLCYPWRTAPTGPCVRVVVGQPVHSGVLVSLLQAPCSFQRASQFGHQVTGAP